VLTSSKYRRVSAMLMVTRSFNPRSEVQKEWPVIEQKHTTGGIPRWSPTLVLVARFSAYVWQSGRDAQFSLTYGRMYRECYVAYHDAKIITRRLERLNQRLYTLSPFMRMSVPPDFDHISFGRIVNK
jgi:hypothetical protein